MNREMANRSLTPKKVITIYGDRSKYGSYTYFLEERDVLRNGDKYILGAARPMPEKIMADLAREYSAKKDQKLSFEPEIMSENILFAHSAEGNSVVIWWLPAGKRQLNFDKKLKIGPSGVLPHPGLLFVNINKSLYVFSVKDNNRPTKKTNLYNAPFFNVYEDGKICLGTANTGTPTGYYQGEMRRFEIGFFAAEQNHSVGGAGAKTSLPNLWKSLLKKNQFPNTELLPHKTYKNIGDIFSKLIHKHINDGE